MTNTFKLPIHYNKHKCTLGEDISAELELLDVHNSNSNSVFGGMFSPSNPHTVQILKDMVETYTIDTIYLKDTQELFGKYTISPTPTNIYDDIVGCLGKIRSPTFINTYGYIKYEHFSAVNTYDYPLQIMAAYTIISPIITIATPLIIIIVPFIILNFGIQPIDFKSYMEILKTMGKSHPVIGLIMNFGQMDNEQKVYQLLTFALYIFSIYRQCMDCYAFVKNIIELNAGFIKMNKYITNTIQCMRHYASFTYQLKSYETFNQSLSQNINELLRIQDMVDTIIPFTWSVKALVNIGTMLKVAYIMHTDSELQSSLEYAINFNSYLEIFNQIHLFHKSGKINPARFVKNRQPKLRFTKMIYPSHNDVSTAVSNDIKLDKNIIITGPNASGKTTMLKSVLINVLFTQQYGMGFYKSAVLTPFRYLHCYLNIPDTNGRDSLFQAEARRCKHILDSIHTKVDGKHLCILDELYSGTNPEEAISGSRNFLQYITKKTNVKWMLTTHYIELCTQLDKTPLIANYHMKVTDDFKYLYKLKPSISKIKGAFKILEDMDFPKEMLKL